MSNAANKSIKDVLFIEVDSQMRQVKEESDAEPPTDYRWLSRLSSKKTCLQPCERRALEELAMKLQPSECVTLVLRFRSQAKSLGTPASQLVPLMIQIAQDLFEERSTMQIWRRLPRMVPRAVIRLSANLFHLLPAGMFRRQKSSASAAVPAIEQGRTAPFTISDSIF